MSNHQRIKPADTSPFEEQVAIIGSSQWSVARLAKLSARLKPFKLPVAHMNLSDMIGPQTLRQMAGHVNCVMSADTSRPIILDEDGNIMDGRHRVVRAIVDGRKSLMAVRFDVNPDPCQVNDDE